jgi:hypothetical protein
MTSMCPRVAFTALVVLLSTGSIASAHSEPPFDLREVTNQSDVVVLGTIVDLADLGETVLRGNNWAHLIGGHIAVHQVFKGHVAANAVPFRSLVWTVHLNSIAKNTHGVVFLKRTPFNLEFVSPAYPMLATVPIPLVASRDAYEAVLESLTAVLRYAVPPVAADNELLKLVWNAVLTRRPADILAIMRRGLDARDPTVRFNCVRMLLRVTGAPFVSAEDFRADEATYRAKAIFVLSQAGQP